MDLGRRLLGEPQPAAVVLQRVLGVDAPLHADLCRSELDRLADSGPEVVLADVVGVRRALALAEAAEGAADDADVGEVDVAVDDEGRGLAGQLGSQAVGGDSHLLDHLRPRLREQGGQLVLGELGPLAALGDRLRRQPGFEPLLATPARSPPGDEAPVAELDHIQHPLLHPFGVHVLGIDAEALGQRVALRGQRLAQLVRAREGVLGGDVVAVGREAAEVRGAGGDELGPPVGEVRGHLDAHLGHQPPALGDQPLHVLDRHLAGPFGHRCRLPVGDPRLPAASRRLVGDLGDLLTVVAPVGDEVLQDHLLDVPVARLHLGERLQRGDPLLLGLPDPDQDPARERDPQLAGCLDRRQPCLRVLARRAGVDGLHQALGDRLQHQPLRRGHLAQPGQVRRGEDAEIGVGKEPAFERPLAGPDHVGGEVVVPPGAQALGDDRVDLRPLAGEDEQLLAVPARRLLEAPLHLLRRMDVGLMGGEGAVLAEAPAGARKRERVVAREGDSTHERASYRTGPGAPVRVLGWPGTRSGGSVGATPPGSSTNRKTAAARSAPTKGPTT